MRANDTTRMTPLTGRADRADARVRTIEEAVLLIRGEWPAVADGLCESVNRAAGIFFAPARELDDAIGRTSEEALRVVERLYGPDSATAVRTTASARTRCRPGRSPSRAQAPTRMPRLREEVV